MTREEILLGLKEVMQMVKPKADLSAVCESTRLLGDLGIDSLSMLLASLAIETRFGIRFENQVPFETVGDVMDSIEGLCK